MKHLLLFLCVIAGAGCVRPPQFLLTKDSTSINNFVREYEEMQSTISTMRQRLELVDSRIIEGRSKVSYYSDHFEGKVTASGVRFSNSTRQVAHKELPFGSMIFFYGGMGTADAKRLSTCKVPPAPSTYGCITDRGPFIEGRDFDITYKMATELGMVEQGVVEVNWIGLKGGVR